MTDTSPSPLRYIVIGAGAVVFDMHKRGLELPISRLVGVCDVNAEAAEKVAAAFGCPAYTDYQTMLREAQGQADVCAVLTPHPLHARQTIDALNAGFHVLVEKPMAVHVADADAMIAAAEQNNRVLAVNFQQRLRPEIQAAKQIIDSGQLGRIQHVDIKITWTRTAAYYRMGGWRGTWTGEGGAVTMNQGPHELDLLCYLVGRPARVYAWTRTIAHDVQCEDTVQAMVEWPDGALGSIHISTAEAGQPQRFEVLATKGRLEIGPGVLRFSRFDTDLLEFLRNDPRPFAEPQLIAESVPLGTTKGEHAEIYRDLHRAITTGTPPIAPGSSGIFGLELANAMTYSSFTGQAVDFPLDRAQYAALLANLQAGK